MDDGRIRALEARLVVLESAFAIFVARTGGEVAEQFEEIMQDVGVEHLSAPAESQTHAPESLAAVRLGQQISRLVAFYRAGE